MAKTYTFLSRSAYIALIALFLIFFGFSIQGRADSSMPKAKAGLLDLRQVDLSNNINLNGEWQFYWHALITPEDLPSLKPGKNVTFPFQWNKKDVNGHRYNAFGYATYRVKILLPHSREHLSLIMPRTYSAYRLYINDLIVAKNGQVCNTPEGFRPYWNYSVVDVPDNVDSLDVLLQIANFVHSKGGISNQIVLGQRNHIYSSFYISDAINLLIAGCMFMGGVFFLGLYLLTRKDKAMLAFALFGIAYSYHFIGAEHYELHRLLPDLSWFLTIRLEYISMFAGLALFTFYTRHLFPKNSNKYVLDFILIISISFAVESLFLSPEYFSMLATPFIGLIGGGLLYLPLIYFSAFKQKQTGSAYSLISLVFLLPVCAYEVLMYFGIVEQQPMVNLVGYTIFYFFQSLVLSHRFAFDMKRAKEEAELGSKAKSEFLSVMSHEIRTPLNSVVGISNILLQNNPRNDQQEHLDSLLFSANNLTSIVNDILDFSKIEAGKITFENIEFDIADIARKIIAGQQAIAKEKMLDLKLSMDGRIQKIIVSGDPTRYFQVLNNIVHNAIKFTDMGYVDVRLVIEEETDTIVKIKTSVKDTGIGISKDKKERIFDEFTQADSSISRSYGGTGLGLTICKKILQLQQSRLIVESELGIGSIFHFTQSFSKREKPRNETNDTINTTSNKLPLENVKVLVVEDNPMNVMVARTFLKRWGADVSVAVNGEEGVECFYQYHPDLILMDVHMPVMDGFQAIVKLRSDGVIIPIVALTADIQEDTLDRLKKVGANGVISKPLQPDDLLKELTYILKRKSN